MQSKIIETDEIKKLGEMVVMAQKELNDRNEEKNNLKIRLRDASKQGQSISSSDVEQLQTLEVQCKVSDKRMRLFTLNYDIERICVYLCQEIESSSSANTPFDQRSLIAEIALIDKQLSTILLGLRSNIDNSISISDNSDSLSTTGSMSELLDDTDLVSLIDDDELTLICSQVSDMKMQLGLGALSGSNMDWGSLGVAVTDSLNKIKQGLSFYGEGTKILLNDLQYAWILITRAIQGYTLKPRFVCLSACLFVNPLYIVINVKILNIYFI
jgi:hypothetical protein